MNPKSIISDGLLCVEHVEFLQRLNCVKVENAEALRGFYEPIDSHLWNGARMATILLAFNDPLRALRFNDGRCEIKGIRHAQHLIQTGVAANVTVDWSFTVATKSGAKLTFERNPPDALRGKVNAFRDMLAGYIAKRNSQLRQEWETPHVATFRHARCNDPLGQVVTATLHPQPKQTMNLHIPPMPAGVTCTTATRDPDFIGALVPFSLLQDSPASSALNNAMCLLGADALTARLYRARVHTPAGGVLLTTVVCRVKMVTLQLQTCLSSKWADGYPDNLPTLGEAAAMNAKPNLEEATDPILGVATGDIKAGQIVDIKFDKAGTLVSPAAKGDPSILGNLKVGGEIPRAAAGMATFLGRQYAAGSALVGGLVGALKGVTTPCDKPGTPEEDLKLVLRDMFGAYSIGYGPLSASAVVPVEEYGFSEALVCLMDMLRDLPELPQRDESEPLYVYDPSTGLENVNVMFSIKGPGATWVSIPYVKCFKDPTTRKREPESVRELEIAAGKVHADSHLKAVNEAEGVRGLFPTIGEHNNLNTCALLVLAGTRYYAAVDILKKIHGQQWDISKGPFSTQFSRRVLATCEPPSPLPNVVAEIVGQLCHANIQVTSVNLCRVLEGGKAVDSYILECDVAEEGKLFIAVPALQNPPKPEGKPSEKEAEPSAQLNAPFNALFNAVKATMEGHNVAGFKVFRSVEDSKQFGYCKGQMLREMAYTPPKLEAVFKALLGISGVTDIITNLDKEAEAFCLIVKRGDTVLYVCVPGEQLLEDKTDAPAGSTPINTTLLDQVRERLKAEGYRDVDVYDNEHKYQVNVSSNTLVPLVLTYMMRDALPKPTPSLPTHLHATSFIVLNSEAEPIIRIKQGKEVVFVKLNKQPKESK